MFLSSRGQRLALPESLWMQMLAFRRRVWAIRLIEACCGAAFGVLMGYLITFCLDRVWDTPAIVRLGIFAAAIIACAVCPLHAPPLGLAAAQAGATGPLTQPHSPASRRSAPRHRRAGGK